MSVFDEGDDISVIGTGADELCSGRAQVKDLFPRNSGEAQARRFEWDWIRTSVTGDHAVVAATLTIHLEMNGSEIRVPVRWTVVLRNRGDHWVWPHRHASSAAPNPRLSWRAT